MDMIQKGTYDVIVVGGGVAGVAAAVSAARQGAETLLIEKSVTLGGLATNGLISWYEPLCNGEGKQTIGGMAEELLQLAVRYGFDDLPKEWGGTTQRANKRYATHFSPAFFSLALTELCVKNGVTVRFDTLTTYPKMERNICQGVLCESVSGQEFFGAKFVIDCTGDCTVMHRAGVPTVRGENFFSYIAHGFEREQLDKYASDQDIGKLRRWYTVGSNLFGKGHPPEMGVIYGDSAEGTSQYIINGQMQLLDRFKNGEKTERELMALPAMPQYRKIRRIEGEYVFKGRDECGGGKTNAIGTCNSIGTVSDFRYAGYAYSIPLECLYNKNFPNLLAAGRVISADGDGWEVTRVIPVCVLTGQAAGVCAAIMSKHKTDCTNFEYPALKNTLLKSGVMF